MFFKIITGLYFLIFFFPLGCTNSSWEDIDSNYDHILNVIGIIDLDQTTSASESFVGVYRTTNLDEKSQIFVRVDTLGYESYESENEEGGFWIVDSIFVPAALIDNAEVIITDEQGNSSNFSFVEFEYLNFDTTLFDTSYFEFGGTIFTIIDTLEIDTIFSTRVNIYKDTTEQFVPLPNMEYKLSINAQGYDLVTGSLITPDYPVINKSLVQDTLSFLNEYEVSWQNSHVEYGLLIEQILIEQDFNYFTTLEKWCWGYKYSVVELSQNIHTVYPMFCDEHSQNIPSQSALIKLMAMDKNYYNYFIRGSSEDYTNITVPNTTKGRSIGLQGGFGVFGSIASDNLIRTILP